MKYTKSNPPIICYAMDNYCYKTTITDKLDPPLGVLWHDTGVSNAELKRYVQPSNSDNNKDELLNLIGVNENHNSYNDATTWEILEENYGGGTPHAVIGKLEDGTVGTVQILPWSYRSWGCNGTANDGWIQFEICYQNDNNYKQEVFEEACQFSAYICMLYNLDPDGKTGSKYYNLPVITGHKKAANKNSILASSHGDPDDWFGNEWEDVAIQRIKKILQDAGNFYTDKPFSNNNPSNTVLVEKTASIKLTPYELNLTNIINNENMKKIFFQEDQNILEQLDDNEISLNIFNECFNQLSLSLNPNGLIFSSKDFIHQESLNYLINNIDNYILQEANNQVLSSLNYKEINSIKNNLNLLLTEKTYNNEQVTNISTNNYLTYPMKKMYISQSYDGTTSHYKHLKGTYIDYPIDETGGGTGQESIYCPCDSMKIIKKKFNGTSIYYLQSLTPVIFANGTSDYVIIQFIHSEDNIDEERIFSRGEEMFKTGQKGNASGNHIHMSVGKGLIVSGMSVPYHGSSIYNDIEIVYTSGGALKPEDAFWINPNFTTILNSSGLNFKTLTNA